MILSSIVMVIGLVLLVWSADRFVEGSAVTARHLGVPPLIIGMVIIGFGTSVPEMVVSALAAVQGNPGLAIGNAYGSNIANIALILGLAAIINPIAVQSSVIRRELPILTAVTILSFLLVRDQDLSRLNAWTFLFVFAALMGWTVRVGLQHRSDSLSGSMTQELDVRPMRLSLALFWLVLGLALLILSSRMLVWGAVEIAHTIGISDLVIGLTIVAVGTSLPELASSIIAAHRGQHDLALGNVIGSNLFNTLAVVGIAGAIHPMPIPSEVIDRDMLVMGALTLSLFVIGYGFRGPGRISRLKGGLLLCGYFGYTGYVISTVLRQ